MEGNLDYKQKQMNALTKQSPIMPMHVFVHLYIYTNDFSPTWKPCHLLRRAVSDVAILLVVLDGVLKAYMSLRPWRKSGGGGWGCIPPTFWMGGGGGGPVQISPPPTF